MEPRLTNRPNHPFQQQRISKNICETRASWRGCHAAVRHAESETYSMSLGSSGLRGSPAAALLKPKRFVADRSIWHAPRCHKRRFAHHPSPPSHLWQHLHRLRIEHGLKIILVDMEPLTEMIRSLFVFTSFARSKTFLHRYIDSGRCAAPVTPPKLWLRDLPKAQQSLIPKRFPS